MALTFSLSRPFARLSNQPIDDSAVFSSLSSLTAYADSDPIAYPGQIVALSSTDTAYIIGNNKNAVVVGGAIHITDLSNTKTFDAGDTNRIFHFNTTSQILSAIFPLSLPDGFNVALMNTGTNNLRLSAVQLNSMGTTVFVQYGGAFVYKDNGQLFAVGRL
jgi:hypothetical protein